MNDYTVSYANPRYGDKIKVGDVLIRAESMLAAIRQSSFSGLAGAKYLVVDHTNYKARVFTCVEKPPVPQAPVLTFI